MSPAGAGRGPEADWLGWWEHHAEDDGLELALVDTPVPEGGEARSPMLFTGTQPGWAIIATKASSPAPTGSATPISSHHSGSSAP